MKKTPVTLPHDPSSDPNGKKKRGAQLRNRNAFKHGFYAYHAQSRLSPASIFNDDIRSLILNTHRVVSAVTQNPDLSLEDHIKALHAVSRAAACIKTLHRLDRIIRIAVKIDSLLAPFRALFGRFQNFLSRNNKLGRKKMPLQ